MDAIELQYFKDFQKKDYDAAVSVLWEEHCAGHFDHWPPTVEQIKEAMDAQKEDPAPRR